jgi:hypothetical protein
MDDTMNFLQETNRANFDGRPFSIFGRPQKQVFTEGNDSIWIDDKYYIDSAVLCPKGNPNEYYTFFIRRIDGEGNIIEI